MRNRAWVFAVLPLLFCAAGLGAESKSGARVVFMIGEDEYKTWETLPEFARTDLEPKGFRVTIVQADALDKNNFPGLVKALKEADLLFISLRRRTPPADQLQAVRAHLQSGKPLIGIRTACHAFALQPKDKAKLVLNPKLAEWAEFDPEVLGGHYTGHYAAGPKSTITVAAGAAEHPILKGVEVRQLLGNGALYKVSPLADSARPLLIGTITGEAPEPVAWTRLYGAKQARIFYTSLGHPDDFRNPQFRRLLVNGVQWALE
jgi:type 1 glutamine amidotransferase